MAIESSDSNTHPHNTVTDSPLAKEKAKVVLRPYGTAMMANDKPNTDIMLKLRGSSALYPMRASASSAAVAAAALAAAGACPPELLLRPLPTLFEVDGLRMVGLDGCEGRVVDIAKR